MKKNKFNGRGAVECQEIDWSDFAIDKESGKKKKASEAYESNTVKVSSDTLNFLDLDELDDNDSKAVKAQKPKKEKVVKAKEADKTVKKATKDKDLAKAQEIVDSMGITEDTKPEKKEKKLAAEETKVKEKNGLKKSEIKSQVTSDTLNFIDLEEIDKIAADAKKTKKKEEASKVAKEPSKPSIEKTISSEKAEPSKIDKEVTKADKKKSKKKKEEAFDIENVQDGFDVEFDSKGRALKDKERDIKRSVDQKIIIQSEELKKKRSEKGFFKKLLTRDDEFFDEEDEVVEAKSLKQNAVVSGLNKNTSGKSGSFREKSANWLDSDVKEADLTSDDNIFDDENLFEKILHASWVSKLSIAMAIVLLVTSVFTTCAFADYNSAKSKWAALENMPQYKEEMLASYSDREVDTLDVEMQEAAALNEEENKVLSLVLTSVEKDLKIKLVDNEDNLVKDVAWGVVITDEDEEESYFDDEDMDGIIHITDMAAGDYSVAMADTSQLEGYEYSVEGQKVSVKSKVEYKVIANIKEEIKKESEVNVALEDPNGNQAADVETGTPLTDTVEWVESTETEEGEEYEEATVDLSQTEKLYALVDDIKSALKSFKNSTRTLIQGLDGGFGSVGAMLTPVIMVADNEEGSSDSSEAATTTNPTEQQIKDAIDNYNKLQEEYEKYQDTINNSTENTDTSTNSSEETTSKEVKSVTIDKSSLQLAVKSGAVLNLSYTPEGATPQQIKWSSSNESVLAVKDGAILGLANGTARVTAVIDGKITVYCDVTVGDGATESKISLSGASTVKVSESITIEASLTPDSDSVASWSASDSEVISLTASENKAVIKGLKAGKTTITAKSTSGQSAAIEITVNENDGEYAGNAQLYDSNKNKLYVFENNTYRLAKYADYKSGNFQKYFRKKGETLYTGWQVIDGDTYYYTENHEKVTGTQVIGGISYSFDANGVLSKGSGTLGIDVSKYQPSINWNSVKASGISFVIIRCGYRGASTGSLIQDPYFASHIKGAKAAGLKVGVYFFSTALTEAEAVEEASMCAALCSGYGLDYPVFIDVESSSRPGYNSLSAAQRTANIKAFCQTISSAGYTPGLYANKTWLTSYINTSQLSCKIWLAQYNAAGPTYTGRYDIWQYTSKGSVDGISGNVDMNKSYL